MGENCDAARDAGAAPVREGEPGYRSGLDRDGDGVGCEWVQGRGRENLTLKSGACGNARSCGSA
ncbi:hypothetical protein GCM10009830_03200 [Glycomyces endophyticus]|uniref:Excalibur calcium-binding domain-containing protein n=1 Tax=Glycomyces endophyticus TaxID=480996 RepID=A0ABP4RVY0_9ACTN